MIHVFLKNHNSMRTDVNKEGSFFLPQGLFAKSATYPIQSTVLSFVILFVNCFLYIVKILASTSMSQRDMSAGETSLAQKTFRGRLKSNPMLGVADLMKAFQKLIDFHASRDIRRILDPPADMDWKSAPHAKWICRQSVLFSALLDCAPNTVLTSRKVKEALQRLHDEGGSLNSTRKDDGILWDIIDTKIRIGMAQLRELKNNRDLCLDRARRKLSEEEQGLLQSLLDKVHFSSEDSPTSGAPPATTQHQLVVASPSPPTTTAQQHEQEQQSAKHQNGKEQHGRPATPKRSSAASSSVLPAALPAAPTQQDMSNLFDSILLGKSTKAKKKQESQTKDVTVTTSSETSTPDKKRKADMLLSTRKRLSFEDTDEDEDEDPTEEDSPRKVKIKLLPKGVQIMASSKKDKEKKRPEKLKERSREESRTKKKKTKTEAEGVDGQSSATTGFFLDGLLDSWNQQEEDPHDDDDAVEPNKDDKKTDRKKKDKEDKKKQLTEQTAGARDRDFLDPASRFLLCCCGGVLLWSFFDVVVECQLLRDSAGVIDCLCERCRLERVVVVVGVGWTLY